MPDEDSTIATPRMIDTGILYSADNESDNAEYFSMYLATVLDWAEPAKKRNRKKTENKKYPILEKSDCFLSMQEYFSDQKV